MTQKNMNMEAMKKIEKSLGKITTPRCILVADRCEAEGCLVGRDYYLLGVFEKEDTQSIEECMVNFRREYEHPSDDEVTYGSEITIAFSVVEEKYPVLVGSAGYVE